jgi:hypothetical protein
MIDPPSHYCTTVTTISPSTDPHKHTTQQRRLRQVSHARQRSVSGTQFSSSGMESKHSGARRPAVSSALRAHRVFYIKKRSTTYCTTEEIVRAIRPWYVTWGQCTPTLVRWAGNNQTATTKESGHLSLILYNEARSSMDERE